MDYLAVLKDLITNYEKFCHVAVGLEWIKIEAEYNDWFKVYPMGINIGIFGFPEGYVQNNFANAYVRAVLSGIAFYEEWDKDFFDIPQSGRKKCLDSGGKLYEEYAIPSELRFIKRDWEYLAKEIRFFAGLNKIPLKEQENIISKIQGAEVIETGGSYYADYEYVAVKGDTVIMVCCGLWD